MPTDTQLTEFYQTELEPLLKTLEKQRKGVLSKLILAFICLVGAFVVMAKNLYPEVIATAFIIGFLILSTLAYLSKDKYVTNYKSKIVGKLIKFINPEYEYHPFDHIAKSVVKNSALIEGGFNRFKGDDLVIGTFEKTRFQFSEIKTKKVEQRGKNTHVSVTFHGLFLVADFNKHIQGATYIYPDMAEKLFGKWGQKLQFSSKGRLVKLENTEFEKEFVVFSTSQQEARYILTPEIMERILKLNHMVNHKMMLSFLNSSAHIAIDFRKNLFEPKVFSSGINKEDVETMFLMFSLIEIIIHQLNLNTRIWTKE